MLVVDVLVMFASSLQEVCRHRTHGTTPVPEPAPPPGPGVGPPRDRARHCRSGDDTGTEGGGPSGQWVCGGGGDEYQRNVSRW